MAATRNIQETLQRLCLQNPIPSHHKNDFEAILYYFRESLRRSNYLQCAVIWRHLLELNIPKELRKEKSELLIPLLETSKTIEWFPTEGNMVYTGKLSDLLITPNFARGISHYFYLIPSSAELGRHVKHFIYKELGKFNHLSVSSGKFSIKIDLGDLKRLNEIHRVIYKFLRSDDFLENSEYSTYIYKNLYYRAVMYEYSVYVNGNPYCCYNFRFGHNWVNHINFQSQPTNGAEEPCPI